jgi:hypothetical protein
MSTDEASPFPPEEKKQFHLPPGSGDATPKSPGDDGYEEPWHEACPVCGNELDYSAELQECPRCDAEAPPAKTATPVVVEEPAEEHLPATVASPMDLPPAVFQEGLDRRGANRKALIEWVRANLVEGVDFGRIHIIKKDKCPRGRNCTNKSHFSKPSMFKPGAEKVCGMLGVTPTYPTLKDYEQAALAGVEIKTIILRCEILNAAMEVIAHGVGGRNVAKDGGDVNKALKMAEKSGHIDAALRLGGMSELFTQDIEDMDLEGEEPPNPTCPSCGKVDAVIKGKEEYGGGWVCWKRKNGCGHGWQDAPKEKEGAGAEQGTPGEASAASPPEKAKPAPAVSKDRPAGLLYVSKPEGPPPGYPSPIRTEDQLVDYTTRFVDKALEAGHQAEVLADAAARDVNGLFVYCPKCYGPCYQASSPAAVTEFGCMGKPDGQGGYAYCPETNPDGSPSMNRKGEAWRLGWKRPQEGGAGTWYTRSWPYSEQNR